MRSTWSQETALAVHNTCEGAGKQDAVVGLVEGPVTAMCPCSALQYHNDCIVICDEEAAGKLQNKDYYKYIFSQTGVSNV
jgi:6-phosphogluconolactonase/glucosamine-6-phosphate isomerase/deaminase